MARTTKTTVNEVENKEKVQPIKENKEMVQPIKENKKQVLTANSVDMHKKPDLLTSSIVGKMPVNTLFEVIDEVNNVFGSFYKLDNGFYISKNNIYTFF